MIFTAIGVALRCISEAAWRQSENLQGLCNVLTVVYVILCVIGVWETYLGRNERPAAATIALFIFQIAISLYFGFASDSIITKIIGGIIVFCLLGGIMSAFSSDKPSSNIDDSDIDKAFSALDNMCEENMRKVQEEADDYNSRLSEINYAKRYGKSGKLYSSDGDEIEFNDDGTMFKDKYGKWHYC